MKGLDNSSALFQSSLRSVGSLSDEGLNNEGHSAKKAKVSIVANSSLASISNWDLKMYAIVVSCNLISGGGILNGVLG